MKPKPVKITKRDAIAITALLDTLAEWSDNFTEGSYAKDWKHYWNKVHPKLIAIEYSKGLK